MKKFRKVMSLVLALALVFGLSATAFAADPQTYSSTSDAASTTGFSITIENSTNGQTYNAYKIFDVTYSDEDDDGNVNYSYTITNTETYDETTGTTTNSNAWYDLFTKNSSFSVTENGEQVTYAMPFVFTETSVTGVYNVTVATNDDGDPINTDDQIIGYLTAAIAELATYENGVWSTSLTADGTATGTGSTVTIGLTEPGYYFVTSGVGAIVSVTTTDPNPTIVDKNPTIDIEKYIVHDDNSEDAFEADGIGEDVSFDVKASVPKTEGENYVLDYTLTDTMTNGLLIELDENHFFYDSTTGKYYAFLSNLSDWMTITLKDGAGNEITDLSCLYGLTVELVGYDTYTDDTAGTLHTFSGFILTYYTYDVTAYKTALFSALGNDSSIWPDYPDGWPDADSISDDFDFDSESYFDSSSYPTNASIEIQYSAHVSSLEGYENTNTIYLDHDVTPFNHPTPWNPTPGPQQFARDYVYSWELQILKIDGEDSTPLSGATFTLESDDMKDVKVGHSYLYVPVSQLTDDTYTYEGTTYKVADFESTYYIESSGTYTAVSVDLVLDEDGNYRDGYSANTVYRRILTDEVTEGVDTTQITIQGTTDESGKLYFEGLGTGTYTLTEIVAPDGYNLLDNPIIFQITFEEKGDEATGYEGVFTVTYGEMVLDESTGEYVFQAYSDENQPEGAGVLTDNYIFELDVENNSGTILPGTGGMGTTWFYIIGAILVCGAVVVLVTRRRVNAKAA